MVAPIKEYFRLFICDGSLTALVEPLWLNGAFATVTDSPGVESIVSQPSGLSWTSDKGPREVGPLDVVVTCWFKATFVTVAFVTVVDSADNESTSV